MSYIRYPAEGGGGGSGTVTSVAMSVPAFLSVSGSPVTTTGTLAVSLSGTALPVANGGTGLTTPGTSGNVLTSNGSAWVSSAPATAGDVVGPSSATDNALSVFNSTTGKLIKNSNIIYSSLQLTVPVNTTNDSSDGSPMTIIAGNKSISDGIGGGLRLLSGVNTLQGYSYVGSVLVSASEKVSLASPGDGGRVVLSALDRIRLFVTSVSTTIPTMDITGSLVTMRQDLALLNMGGVGNSIDVGTASFPARTVRAETSMITPLVAGRDNQATADSVTVRGGNGSGSNKDGGDLFLAGGTLTGSGRQGVVSVSTGFAMTALVRNVAVDGGSATIVGNCGVYILDPAGLLATYTLTMPAAPADGQIIRICAGSFGITALTLSPNTGQTFSTGAALTAITASGFATYVYRSANTNWYRIG